MFASSWTNGQEFECEKYYKEYCKAIQLDTTNLPNYTAGYFFSEDAPKKDKLSIEGCINDLDAFCKGIEMAMNLEQLSLRQIGDPGHVSQCSYYSFERLGVKLIMTGVIILDAGIFDDNAGFNFIMEKRIKKEIGEENYNLLGIKDSTWLELEAELWGELIKVISTDLKADSIALIRLETQLLRETKFQHLDGVIFTDYTNNYKFDSSEFQNGVEIIVKGNDNKYGLLKVDFRNYKNPMFCRGGFSSEYTIPIKIIQ